MTAELGAAPPSPDADLVVFEPQGDRPAREEPLIAPLVETLSRRRRVALIRSPLLLALWTALFIVDGQRSGFVLPLLMIALSTAWTAVAVYAWWQSSPAVRRQLLNLPLRRVPLGPGDLRATRRRVCVRVGAGPEEQWFAFGPASLYAPFLARKRRVWVLGPGPRGRVLVFVPGLVIGIGGRVRPQPLPGAQSVDAAPSWLAAPKDDVVLRSFIGFQRRWSMVTGGVLLAAAVGLALLYVPPLVTDGWVGEPFWPLCGSLLAVLLVFLAASVLPRLARLGGAAQAITWVPLPFALDHPLTPGVARMTVTGRVVLPDGSAGSVRLNKVTVNLAASVAASGQLWVMGGVSARGDIAVGVPGHLLSGFASLRRV